MSKLAPKLLQLIIREEVKNAVPPTGKRVLFITGVVSASIYIAGAEANKQLEDELLNEPMCRLKKLNSDLFEESKAYNVYLKAIAERKPASVIIVDQMTAVKSVAPTFVIPPGFWSAKKQS